MNPLISAIPIPETAWKHLLSSFPFSGYKHCSPCLKSCRLSLPTSHPCIWVTGIVAALDGVTGLLCKHGLPPSTHCSSAGWCWATEGSTTGQRWYSRCNGTEARGRTQLPCQPAKSSCSISASDNPGQGGCGAHAAIFSVDSCNPSTWRECKIHAAVNI